MAPTITTLRKAQSSLAKLFSPKALASDGENLYVHSWLRFYNDLGGRLSEVLQGSLDGYGDGLAWVDGVLFATGSDGVACSTDGGETWSSVTIPTDEAMRVIAVDGDQGLWAAGGYHGGGRVVYRKSGTKAFKNVSGPKDLVKSMQQSSKGVLVGDRKGDVWLGQAGKLKKLHAAKKPILAVFETSTGTILASAAEELDGDTYDFDTAVLLRSTDGGKSFTTTQVDDPIMVFGEVPNGPVIAGGDELVMASKDDGESFVAERQTLHAPCQAFTTACVHDGALLLAGPYNHLIEFRMGGKKAAKKPAKKRAAKKPMKKRAAKKKPTKKRAAKKKR